MEDYPLNTNRKGGRVVSSFELFKEDEDEERIENRRFQHNGNFSNSWWWGIMCITCKRLSLN